MKTGFTCGSGYNLISVARQNGKRLIGVIMGGISSERYKLMIDMMDDGFSNQFNPYPARNINTMTTSYAGMPPYQLGCGNLAHTTMGSNDTSDSSGDQPRLIRKSNYISNTRYLDNHQKVTKAKASNKHKTAGKAKPIKMSKSVSKAKPAGKSKTVSKAKPVGKKTVAANQNLPARARPLASQKQPARANPLAMPSLVKLAITIPSNAK